MCVRTWALWRRDFRVGVVLATMMTVTFVAQCMVIVKFNSSLIIEPPPFKGYRGCFLVGASSLLEYTYVMWLIVDAVVLALIATSAFKAYKLGDTSRLLNVVHRDGIMFYVYLLVFSIANVIFINVVPGELRAILSPLDGILYSVFTSRIILNIRAAARPSPNDTDMELHTQRVSQPVVRDCKDDGDEVWVHKIAPGGGDLFSS